MSESSTSISKKKVNDIPVLEPEELTKAELRTISVLRHLSCKIGFGSLMCNFSIKNDEIVNLKKISGEENYNIGRF